MATQSTNLKEQNDNSKTPAQRTAATLPHLWRKGVSGNPAGRPKNEPLLAPELRRQLGQICPEDPKKRTWCVYLMEKMLILAAKGNPAAIKEVFERTEGKVKDVVELDVQLNAVKSMTDEQLQAIISGQDIIDITARVIEQNE
jgi:hypothetical protein